MPLPPYYVLPSGFIAFPAKTKAKKTVTFKLDVEVSKSTKTQNFLIPFNEENPKVLRYIGFTRPAAEEIWKQYQNRPIPEQQHDLMGFVACHISILLCDAFQNMEPRVAMAMIGLDSQTQEDILSPKCSEYMSTGNLHFAIKDNLTKRYSHLAQKKGWDC